MAQLDLMVLERTAELAAERERLTITLRSMGDGVIVLDRIGKIILMNEAASKMAGGAIKDAIGSPLSSVIPALSRADTPPGETRSSVLPHDVVMNDGAGRILQALSTPIMDGPEAGGSVLLVRDVTDERASREQQEQEGRLAALGQMAAGIARDFKNFLTGVITSAETLSRMPGATGQNLRILERMAESGRRTAQLVRQVLEFSRESVAPREPIDLARFVAGMDQLMRAIVPENVEVTVSVEPDRCQVRANAAQLQQVLTNLVANAADAASGKGRIDIHLGLVTFDESAPPPLPGRDTGTWAATPSRTGSPSVRQRSSTAWRRGSPIRGSPSRSAWSARPSSGTSTPSTRSSRTRPPRVTRASTPSWPTCGQAAAWTPDPARCCIGSPFAGECPRSNFWAELKVSRLRGLRRSDRVCRPPGECRVLISWTAYAVRPTTGRPRSRPPA
jgi:PAS domain S-box-containing protein